MTGVQTCALPISVEKVLDMSSEEIEENNYKNRIILIGVTRYGGVNDYWLTPYGEISGVMIQAHMVSQTLDAVTSDGKRQIGRASCRERV